MKRMNMTPSQRATARRILEERRLREGESVERARLAIAVGAPITVREGNWLRNLDLAQSRK